MNKSWFQIGALVLSGFFTHTPTCAQAPDSLHLRQSFAMVAAFAAGDHLSNTYLLSDKNALIKFDSTGTAVATYTNQRLGLATSVDAANPLKLLVWYPDFQTVVWLDRTLSEMGRMQFSALGRYAISTVAMSADGNIWAFDESVSTALKLNLSGELLLESQPLSAAIGVRFSATRIRDNGQTIALADPQSGLCSLDQFGALQRFDPGLKTADFEWNGEWLTYVQDSTLYMQQHQFMRQRQIPLPTAYKPGMKTWLGKNAVYLQAGAVLQQFDWE